LKEIVALFHLFYIRYYKKKAMGGSQSSNVASAIAKVANSVEERTSGNADQITNCSQTLNLSGCTIKGSLDVKNACNLSSKLSQVTTQLQETNLKSDITQQLVQEAASTVGSMGIGYASASNTASSIADMSNVISSSIQQAGSQYGNISQYIFCGPGTTIDGPAIIENVGSVDFFIDQIQNNTQVSSIANSITQDISQKATATVEGLGGFLIALAVLIIAIGYVFFKPVAMIFENKILMVLIVALIIGFILMGMYWRETPPFFGKPDECSLSTMSGCKQGVDCVDVKEEQTVTLAVTPLRYSMDLVGGGDASLCQSAMTKYKPGLLQTLIQSKSGWTEETHAFFETSALWKTLNLPNPIVCDSAPGCSRGNCDKCCSNPNDGPWRTNSTPYTDSNINPKILIDMVMKARYACANLLGIPTDVYIYDNEYVTVNGEAKIVNELNDDERQIVYRFTPQNAPASQDLFTAIRSGGIVTGAFGICDTPANKIQRFVGRWGPWALVAGFVALIASTVLRKSPSK
jgi:hypothetical protein